ncbi:MAG: DUF5666 domain-containing protein [Terriglobia bacterium]
MHWTRTMISALALALMAGSAGLRIAAAVPARVGWAAQSPQKAAPGARVRSIGTVQAIHDNAITLKTDAGSEVNVLVQDSTGVVRIEPGQKTLKGATPIRLQDLQVGDRILVGGETATSSKSVLASSIIAMKRSDIEQKQRQEEEEWQRHGVGGLVKAVDSSAGTVTITASVKGEDKAITIHTSKGTILRRYAPGSVSFQAAKPGTFDQIKPGDQLRARGTLSADGSVVAAAEIVSGSFRNIAGTVISVDPGMNEVTVMDLITKNPVAVKVTADSELRELPDATAEMIAVRLKRGPAGAGPATGYGPGSAPAAAGPSGQQASPSGASGSSQRPQRGGLPGGPPDLDQILRHLPPATVGDLHKGDAVMIVSTEGATPGAVTAIKLVSGVEPILTASPSGRQGAVLQSLWSGFSTSGGGGGESAGAGTPSPASQ